MWPVIGLGLDSITHTRNLSKWVLDEWVWVAGFGSNIGGERKLKSERENKREKRGKKAQPGPAKPTAALSAWQWRRLVDGDGSGQPAA